MHETKTRQMPVVQGTDQMRLVGLLSMTDIVRAQALAAKDAGEVDRTSTPPFAEERETLEA
jgi:CBS domain-containing protein